MIHMGSLLFYIFSVVLLSSAVLVVAARNTVHSVLFLILAFLNGAALFLIAHAEFLAMMLVVVYVGAVAVLFLFVVMMLDVAAEPIYTSLKRYSLVGCLVGGVIAVELILMGLEWTSSSQAFDLTSFPAYLYKGKPNTQMLGNLIYTHYALIFQGAGIILLIAMIGAIVLTLRQREGVRRQKVGAQIAREARNSVSLVDIVNHSGI